MNFYNVIVANYPDKPNKKSDDLDRLVRCQIENSSRVGWSQNSTILITNRATHPKNCTVIKCNLNKVCPTGSKVFGLEYLFDNTDLDGVFWLHDLDAWQNYWFEPPEFKDVGFCHYSRPRINGGSQFWKRSGTDILKKITSEILVNNQAKEEPTIQKFCARNDRVSILNSTFNVGCSGFVERYERAERPIKVSHLHPNNRIAWQTHRLDRNGTGYVTISEGLEGILRKEYNLQKELDSEGKSARVEKLWQKKLKQDILAAT